ncbi:zinc knuckle CX2CX4HX4C containing protein, partial [Tanacetum coccineum]
IRFVWLLATKGLTAMPPKANAASSLATKLSNIHAKCNPEPANDVASSGAVFGENNVVKEETLLRNHLLAWAEVQIPLSSVLEVHTRFEFNLYGYFAGKRIAFLVVENYVRNAWKKYGIVCAMTNSNGLFFFKFSSMEGMNGVLENEHGLSDPFY